MSIIAALLALRPLPDLCYLCFLCLKPWTPQHKCESVNTENDHVAK